MLSGCAVVEIGGPASLAKGVSKADLVEDTSTLPGESESSRPPSESEFAESSRTVAHWRDPGRFVVVNVFLVAAWAITGGGHSGGVGARGLGVGLVLHAWETFVHRPVTEEDVGAELRRHQH